MNSVQEQKKNQTVLLKDRATIELDGVADVISFDEGLISLDTVLGLLQIEGEKMHVLRLDLEKGEVTAEGRINAVFYSEKASSRGGLFSAFVKK